jgi:hypothetical protein
MSADEYRVEATRLRVEARKGWVLSETRQMLLDLAATYDALATAADALARLPIST